MLDNKRCTKLSFRGCEKFKSNFIVFQVTIVHVSVSLSKLIRTDCSTSKLYYVWYNILFVSMCQSCCNHYKLTGNYMQVLIWRNCHWFTLGDPLREIEMEMPSFPWINMGGGRANYYHHTSTHHHFVSAGSYLFIEIKWYYQSMTHYSLIFCKKCFYANRGLPKIIKLRRYLDPVVRYF